MLNNDPTKTSLTRITQSQTEQTSDCPLERLPEELLIKILLMLETPNLSSFGLTCHAYHALTQDRLLWKALLSRYLPWVQTQNASQTFFKECTHLSRQAKLGLCTFQSFKSHEQYLRGVKCDKDRFFTISCDKRLKCWDITTGELVHTLSYNTPINRLEVAGDVLVLGFADGMIKMVDKNELVSLSEFKAHKATINAMHVDGTRLYTSSVKGWISIWDISDPKNVKQMDKFRGHINSVQGLSSCGEVLMSNSYDSCLKIWQLSKGRKYSCMGIFKNIGTVKCILALGESIYAGLENGVIVILDRKTGKITGQLEGHTGTVNALKVHYNVLLSGAADGMIKVWDLHTNRCLQTLGEDHGEFSIRCLDCTDNRIIAGTADGKAMVYDFNFPCLSSYPLEVLEDNHSILKRMSIWLQSSESHDILNLLEQLDPTFQQAIEKFCLDHRSTLEDDVLLDAVCEENWNWVQNRAAQLCQSEEFITRSSQWLASAVDNVRVLVCAELLLHALHRGDGNEVLALLDEFEELDIKLANQLYYSLAIASATIEEGNPVFDPAWAKQVFCKAHHEHVPVYAKLQAVLRFKSLL